MAAQTQTAPSLQTRPEVLQQPPQLEIAQTEVGIMAQQGNEEHIEIEITDRNDHLFPFNRFTGRRELAAQSTGLIHSILESEWERQSQYKLTVVQRNGQITDNAILRFYTGDTAEFEVEGEKEPTEISLGRLSMVTLAAPTS